MKPTTFHAACQRYGEVDLASRTWRGEAQWMVLFDVPPTIAAVWVNEATGRGMPTHRIYCNLDLVDPLQRALDNIVLTDRLHELKTFDGCFEVRAVRNSSGKVSTHSYGLAIDLNAAENPLGADPVLSPEFVHCWEEAGFDWGGRFQYPNGMHFSYAWETTGNPALNRAAF